MESEHFIRKRDAFFVGMRNLCLTDSVAGVCGGCVAREIKTGGGYVLNTLHNLLGGEREKWPTTLKIEQLIAAVVCYATIRVVRILFFFFGC